MTTEYEAMVERAYLPLTLPIKTVRQVLIAAHVPELLADRDRLRAYEPCDPCKATDHQNCTGDCSSECCALADLESRNAALERVAEAGREWRDADDALHQANLRTGAKWFTPGMPPYAEQWSKARAQLRVALAALDTEAGGADD